MRHQAVSLLRQYRDRVATFGAEMQPLDFALDSFIRDWRGLPIRPETRQPYEGIFIGAPIPDGREQAIAFLGKVINFLSGCGGNHESDEQVDTFIREVQGLPPRPDGQPPYAGLFPPTAIHLTLGQLQAIAPLSPTERLGALLPHLNFTLGRYDITTPLRKSHFLAQIAHESDGLRTNEEYASGDAYEFRDDLGNTEPGDGRRFKGRGLIQITGRYNYAACGRDLGVDLIAAPHRLADFDLAALSAGWFWDKEGLNAIADRAGLTAITRRINGGLNGLSDRRNYFNAAKLAFGI